MLNTKPIRLILVRHGNTFESGQTPIQVGARTNLPLTAQGRNQAHIFAKHLDSLGVRPRAIYAGALLRQTESAAIVGKHFHMEHDIHVNEAALTEIDYGLWEGLTSDEIASQWPDEYRHWTAEAKWPAHIFGSSEEAHIKNIKSWLDLLRKTYSSEDTVVGVTSNGVIRFFYLLQEHVKATGDLKVKTGNFCELLLFKDSVQVKTWNVTP